jgi:hypothetical protein
VADDIYTHSLLGWLRTLAIGVATFVGVAYVAYEVAIWASPPFTSSGHHPLMPIGQALIGFASGSVLSIAAMILDRFSQRRKRRAVIDGYMAPAPARALRR